MDGSNGCSRFFRLSLPKWVTFLALMNHIHYRTFLFTIGWLLSCASDELLVLSFMFKMFNTAQECGLEVDKIVDLTKLRCWKPINQLIFLLITSNRLLVPINQQNRSTGRPLMRTNPESGHVSVLAEVKWSLSHATVSLYTRFTATFVFAQFIALKMYAIWTNLAYFVC